MREAMDLLQDRLHNECIVNTFILYNINAVANQRKKVTYKKYQPEQHARQAKMGKRRRLSTSENESVFSDQLKGVTSRNMQYTAVARCRVV